MVDIQQPMGGGGPQLAPRGRRFAAGVVDLILIPVVLGFLIGIVLVPLPEFARGVVLIIVNYAWLVFRDCIFAPGRAMVGSKLTNLTGDKVTPLQAVIRNIPLGIPMFLTSGYPCEMARVFLPTNLLGRRIVYVVFLVLSFLAVIGGIGAGDGLLIGGALIASLAPIAFIVLDKAG